MSNRYKKFIEFTFIFVKKMMMTDLLMITIPAIVVFLTAYFVLRTYLDSVYKLKVVEIKDASKKDIIMMRLQAYERMVLLIERISPANLLIRVKPEQADIDLFHKQLISNVRAEFDHNIAQQLYISNEAWNNILEAKETIITIINLSKEQIKNDETITIYSKQILTNYNSEIKTINNALESLKKEAQKLF